MLSGESPYRGLPIRDRELRKGQAFAAARAEEIHEVGQR